MILEFRFVPFSRLIMISFCYKKKEKRGSHGLFESGGPKKKMGMPLIPSPRHTGSFRRHAPTTCPIFLVGGIFESLDCIRPRRDAGEKSSSLG